MPKRGLAIGVLFLSIILFALPAFAATFDFYGFTRYTDGTAMNNTNITIEIYEMIPGQGPTINSTFSAVSNETGHFNVTNITIYQDTFYKPVIIHFNSSTNTYADYIGASLPEFPYPELAMVSPITFYLKNATTINITAINSTNDPVPFEYQVKDQTLGYPIKENFGSYVPSALVYVPTERNYSIMIYPNQSFPVSEDLSGLSAYYSKTFNTTESMQRLTGYINVTGLAGFDNLSVITYLLEPGRMVYFGDNSMALFNLSGDDYFNTTTGFYNISVVGPAEGSTILAFAVAQNGTNYYGGFKTVDLTYGSDPSETNMTLYGLVGSLSNITAQGWGTQSTIFMNKVRINFFNSTNATYTSFVHMEVQLDYDDYNMTNFTLMIPVSESSNGTVTLPLLNVTGIKRMNLFTSGGAPTKKKFTVAQISAGSINITLKDAFNMEDPDGEVLGDLFIDMVKHNSACNVPVYNSSACSLFTGGEKGKDGVHPLSVVMSGAPISFRMRNANNITVHYVNVDLLASGPPDALFDSDSSDTTGTSTFAQAWKFGSTGPEIYDYVILGIPYTEASTSATGFNDSKDINITIQYLYDENFNAIWDQSTSNTTNISTSDNLTDFRNYLGTEYEAYLNGTDVACNASDENLTSGLCYKDTANNMLWFKILHFSGIGPENNGSMLKANGESCTSASECVGAYCNSNVCASSPPTTTTTTLGGGGGSGGSVTPPKATNIWTEMKKGVVHKMKISDKDIGFKQIIIEINNNANNVKIVVTKLAGKPASVIHSIAGKIYQYIEINTDNLNNSNIKSATIRFNVTKQWIEENGYTWREISLYRYSDNAWQKLSTTMVSEDGTKVEYEATTPGFSVFAVAGEETPITTTTTTTSPVTTTTTTLRTTTTTIPSGRTAIEDYSIYILIIVIIVITALGWIYFHGHKKLPVGKPTPIHK